MFLLLEHSNFGNCFGLLALRISLKCEFSISDFLIRVADRKRPVKFAESELTGQGGRR